MRQPKLDWKRELDKKELKYGVMILLLYLAAIMMATSGCSRRALLQDAHEAGKTAPKSVAAQKTLTPGARFRPATYHRKAVQRNRKLRAILRTIFMAFRSIFRRTTICAKAICRTWIAVSAIWEEFPWNFPRWRRAARDC